MVRDILKPVQFPPQDTWMYSKRYLEMRERLQGTPEAETAPEAIEFFRRDALNRLRKLARKDPELDEAEVVAGFEKMWPRLSQLLSEAWFYAWLKDHTMDSAFLHPYFTNLSATALGILMSAGWSIDVTGRYRLIPPCDAAYAFVRSEPTFRTFHPFRDWNTQQIALRLAKEAGWKYGTERAHGNLPRRVRWLNLCCGTMPELRAYELELATVSKMFEIVAYDNDPKMADYHKLVFGQPAANYGIDFHREDYQAAFAVEAWQGTFDLVSMLGGVSYHNSPEEFKQLLLGVQGMLRPGGRFAFDRQIFDESMKRCVFVLAWRDRSMKPDLAPQAAIEAVKLGIEGTKLGNLQYEVDTFNQQPAIVHFCLTKLE